MSFVQTCCIYMLPYLLDFVNPFSTFFLIFLEKFLGELEWGVLRRALFPLCSDVYHRPYIFLYGRLDSQAN